MVETRIKLCNFLGYSELQRIGREDGKIELILEKCEKKSFKFRGGSWIGDSEEFNFSYIRTIMRIGEKIIQENFYDYKGRLSVIGTHRKGESTKYGEYDLKLMEVESAP